MTSWRYGLGMTFLLLGLTIWVIPPLALLLIVFGAFFITISKKSWSTKILSIVLPILILYFLITSYY